MFIMDSQKKADFKSNHNPAIKVGRVRVKPHKHVTERNKITSETEEVEQEVINQNKNLIISGALTKGDADFPPEAIKNYQEKPLKILNELRNDVKSHQIHQPKKQ